MDGSALELRDRVVAPDRSAAPRFLVWVDADEGECVVAVVDRFDAETGTPSRS
eukprot:m.113219 g.113219  ORF g.113219 m.113219 type:complete len:53 (-) comp51862_c0_seq2:313-471(-)